MMTRQAKLVWVAAAVLTIFVARPLAATDFLYVEDTLEYAELVSVEFDTATRQGMLYLEHDCNACPSQIPFNSSTRLQTPFGANRPLQEIVEWQGHPAMVHYSLPTPRATQVVVYRLNAQIDDMPVDGAQE